MGSRKGIDVKITWIPVGDIAAKMVTAVASGTEPDMVIGGMPYTKFAESGLLLPLDEVVDQLGRDDFFELILQMGTVDGKVYAIPMGWEITWLHIRKDFSKKQA
ncbi:MAG: extracellular solute-binding protein [Candidatus Atribacteria bacterium]|nr:extracellular solute-binding protein [Candidatus Atribacteria bacterium]MCD6349382.1 extracellular solute-binding protein [Candidatus Atribacteria bacterium]